MATDFGRDVSCTTGILTGRFVSGPRLVAEAVYRRITTPRGSLVGSPDYGVDVTGYLGADDRTLRALPGILQNEILNDERVNSCVVTMTQTKQAARSEITLVIECETDKGPFELQVLVSELTTQLLKIVA